MRMTEAVFLNNRAPKIDLKITIKELLEHSIDKFNYIPYKVETDVKDIANLETDIFYLKFNLDFL